MRGIIRNRWFRPGRSRGGEPDPRPAPRKAKPFETDDDLLNQAMQMFLARKDPKRGKGRRGAGEAWTRAWHRSFEASAGSVLIVDLCRRNGLEEVEREIVVVLALSRLGMLEEPLYTCSDVVNFMQRRDIVAVHKALSQEGRLAGSGVLEFDNPGYRDLDRDVDFSFDIAEFLMNKGRLSASRKVDTEKDLLNLVKQLTRSMRIRARDFDWIEIQRMGPPDRDPGSRRVIRRTLRDLEAAMESKPEWPLSRFFGKDWKLSMEEKLIAIALLAKDLGYFPPGDDLFTGMGMAKAANQKDGDSDELLRLLLPGMPLLSSNILRPCSGWSDLLAGNPDELKETEFELTEETLGKIGVEKTHRKKRSGGSMMRDPVMRMDQLVLTERVKQALAMAAAQVRNSEVLFNRWGLGRVFSYGKGMTMLFSGPPGTGKTACAEALAAELGRPILVADYPQRTTTWTLALRLRTLDSPSTA